MKRLLIVTILLLTALTFNVQAKVYSDSINVAGISGTDTVIAISKNYINWGRTFILEVEYSDLDANDATFDLGTRLDVDGGSYTNVGDSTFNSFGSVVGVALPITMDVTTNADSYYSKASFMLTQDDFKGNVLLFKINPGSVSSGYIRYKLQWK